MNAQAHSGVINFSAGSSVHGGQVAWSGIERRAMGVLDGSHALLIAVSPRPTSESPHLCLRLQPHPLIPIRVLESSARWVLPNLKDAQRCRARGRVRLPRISLCALSSHFLFSVSRLRHCGTDGARCGAWSSLGPYSKSLFEKKPKHPGDFGFLSFSSDILLAVRAMVSSAGDEVDDWKHYSYVPQVRTAPSVSQHITHCSPC